MESLLEQFNDFLDKEETNMSIYEKRIGNLILSHFHDICSLNNRQGKRGKYISQLIIDSKNIIINRDTVNSTSTSIQNIKNMSKLTVENFRGFSNEETIKFKIKNIFLFMVEMVQGKAVFARHWNIHFLEILRNVKQKE
ncbi:hypothetical protein NBRC111894_3869 [Sporolactobacillus inulinus]|uniref:Uncharacterized protein n=1 Tax=Sporolactobacillus inulinus TaxID=2078 RepID=A0A4Y1ZGS2_9BACL|nr:hypothetical protein [Sporolactobacillus inulinus]GAY78315.1 hypothetical protein NBRC111894_3869 [Sporolactobacillus inulinus]